jgi:hypothetical protein
MLVVKKQEAPTEEVEISEEGSALFCVRVFQLSNYFVVGKFICFATKLNHTYCFTVVQCRTGSIGV